MQRIVIRLDHRVKCRLRELRRNTRDKGLAERCQMVLLANKRRGREAIAEAVGRSVSWVNRVMARFRDFGIAGLIDRREDNGALKLDEWFLRELQQVVDGTPQDWGYPRPTWTQELLVKVMQRVTGVKVCPGTMSRALKQIKARLGRPRPRPAKCPWPEGRKRLRLHEIQLAVAAGLAASDEAVVYLDEVDIHLNPKIGLDWMNRGCQKEVPTPGKNVKRYACGALDAATGHLTYVLADHKNSLLFITMLKRLVKAYPDKKVIHVVLDNYKIHDSKATREAVAALAGRVKLHFLPPYCPDENKIERVWLDLHANVTRNHRCTSMKELQEQVVSYLANRNRRTARRMSAKKAA